MIFREIGDQREIAICLEGMAEIALAQNQLVEATEFFGAAESLRETIGVPLLSDQRKKRDVKIKTLRLKLGEVGFAKAWAAEHVLETEF